MAAEKITYAQAQRYKIVEGYSVSDLETKVNYFLGNNPTFRAEGPIQMFGHSQYAQAVTETK